MSAQSTFKYTRDETLSDSKNDEIIKLGVICRGSFS